MSRPCRYLQVEIEFVVHAPRQTGKTTAIRALADELTASGRYAALAFSCETGRASGDDFGGAQRDILQDVREQAEFSLPAQLRPPPWPEAPDGSLLKAALTAWAQACPQPLVLFFDEIDALGAATLISVLSQLRAGYNRRPAPFPSSVALCGQRDVRDCHPRNRFAVPRVPGESASGGDPDRLGSASPLNIKVESLGSGGLRRRTSARAWSGARAVPASPMIRRATSWLGRDGTRRGCLK